MFTGKVALGAACESDLECAIGYCATSGVCAGLPGKDQPCPDFFCADGLTCEFDTEKCVPLKATGAACMDAADCLTGVCTASKCAAPVCDGK